MIYNFEKTYLAIMDKYGLQVVAGWDVDDNDRGWAK